MVSPHCAVRSCSGTCPLFRSDYLALVGDAADGYPGIPGYGAKTAASLINLHGPIEKFPRDLLKDNRKNALLFKKLATLKTDAPLFDDVDELQWRGPTKAFPAMTEKIGDARLATRVAKLQKRLSKSLS